MWRLASELLRQLSKQRTSDSNNVIIEIEARAKFIHSASAGIMFLYMIIRCNHTGEMSFRGKKKLSRIQKKLFVI